MRTIQSSHASLHCHSALRRVALVHARGAAICRRVAKIHLRFPELSYGAYIYVGVYMYMWVECERGSVCVGVLFVFALFVLIETHTHTHTHIYKHTHSLTQVTCGRLLTSSRWRRWEVPPWTGAPVVVIWVPVTAPRKVCECVMYVYMCVCVCVCVYIYICVITIFTYCAYIYTHTHTPGRLPDADKGADHQRAIFYKMGMSDQEITALAGAHAVGRCHSDRR
jgi:hypothetical protein